MKNYVSFLRSVNEILTDAEESNIIYLHTHKNNEDSTLDHHNRPLVNFGSCSYLSLEHQKKIKEGAVKAVDDFGTQFSSSRAYMSISLYSELESLLTQIFGYPTVVTPTTTLGHMGVVPLIIEQDDLILIDHYAHNSMRMAIDQIKHRGNQIEMIRHNSISKLKDHLNEQQGKNGRVWYFADSVYSMNGDYAPLDELYDLLDEFDNFHLYIDDAHGMSCYGEKGAGYLLSRKPLHNKVIMLTSLAKGFGSGGGCIIIKDKEKLDFIRRCAPTLITGGPIQPATLGASCASAKLHLSSEFESLQNELRDKIDYCSYLLDNTSLPVISEPSSPIFFIGCHLPKIASRTIQLIKSDGYFLNYGVFPAVPISKSGIRFTITRNHSLKQIKGMVSCLEQRFFQVLLEEDLELNKIRRIFGLTREELSIEIKSELKVQTFTSINDISEDIWDNIFRGRGSFDYNGLQFLERNFTNQVEIENNWDFDYVIIRDENDKIILATFLTTCLCKDDMMMSSDVSDAIEAKRKHDKWLMTSRTTMLGSLLTEGSHLFLAPSVKSKEALKMLLSQIQIIKHNRNSENIILRDFEKESRDIDQIFLQEGYVKTEMPDNNRIGNITFKDESSFISSLSYRSRKHIRHDVLKNKDKLTTRSVKKLEGNLLIHCYQLYLNVKNSNLSLNTFALPISLFEDMANDNKWDTELVYVKGLDLPIAFSCSYLNHKSYNPMVLGMDYDFLKSHKVYKFVLYRVVMRAIRYKVNQINLGFSANLEKKKIGAKQVKTHSYSQFQDHFNLEYLTSLSLSNKEKSVKI
jgi:7-keto-8-aminopelargonate synthetase-like enzyme